MGALLLNWIKIILLLCFYHQQSDPLESQIVVTPMSHQCVDSSHRQKFLFDLPPLIRQLFPLTTTFTRKSLFWRRGEGDTNISLNGHSVFQRNPIKISQLTRFKECYVSFQQCFILEICLSFKNLYDASICARRPFPLNTCFIVLFSDPLIIKESLTALHHPGSERCW